MVAPSRRKEVAIVLITVWVTLELVSASMLIAVDVHDPSAVTTLEWMRRGIEHAGELGGYIMAAVMTLDHDRESLRKAASTASP